MAVSSEKISEMVGNYRNPKIATICSHTALQLFHGARMEGFGTLGICTEERRATYEAFPRACPDEFFIVSSYKDLLKKSIQEELTQKEVIIIPHGSFVEYVGAKNFEEKLALPCFGNRRVLEWESDREKERRWLEAAGIRVPKVFKPDEIRSLCIVKFFGATGGRGFLVVNDREEYERKIRGREGEKHIIQEYIVGVRFYHHYFYSLVRGRLEFFGCDQRFESNIDELHRMGVPRVELEEMGVCPSYVVAGNVPLVVRESLIPRVLGMGRGVVDVSKELFPPGLFGPFCIETVCTPELEFVAFEISARIVAGTNLFPLGSPYSCYLFEEGMSTGRRVALELKEAISKRILQKVVS